MSAAKLKINPISSERIKMLLSAKNMKQTELASILAYTPQHISKILNNKQGVSDEMARRIAALFPPCRFEWIMGYDDFKTTADYSEHIREELAHYRSVDKMAYSLFDEFRKIHETLGYIALFDGSEETAKAYIKRKDEKAVYVPYSDYMNVYKTSVQFIDFMLDKFFKENED